MVAGTVTLATSTPAGDTSKTRIQQSFSVAAESHENAAMRLLVLLLLLRVLLVLRVLRVLRVLLPLAPLPR